MSESTINIACPKCGKAFKLDASTEGQKGRCDECQTKFIIEAVEVVAAPSASVSPKKKNNGPMWATLVLLLGIGGYVAYDKLNLKYESEVVRNIHPRGTKDESKPHEDVSPEESAEPVKEKIPKLTVSFPVKTQFSPIDIREYQRTYPKVYMGWMPNKVDEAKKALQWGSYLGPLGIKIRSHVPQLQSRPAFAANVPDCIRTADGELGLNAAEVVSIAPGSPADGQLQVGDLIVGIEGEMLKSGNGYRPDWKFMHKDVRELQLMLGEKIDQAQGRGDIRMTVMRYPAAGEREHLPVFRKEIWSGKGGNKSVGLQTFDVEVADSGYVTIESNKFDGNIAGDGTIWLDVTLEGDYGTKKLLGMPNEGIVAGYGRPGLTTEEPFEYQGVKYTESLNLHAQGFAKWKLPKGTKRIKGTFSALSYGKVQPKIYHTNSALPLTGIHKEKLVELHFPIGKTGSYSSTYPKDCPKSKLTVTRHTEWLAAQQLENGSWPRLAGYTSDGWDTAWCALALMSSGDSKYDAQVKKAAYRIAYETTPSEWIAERSMRLMLLSEYYLRTKDEKIVAGIQAAYEQVVDCCKTDFMSGHKVNGFGYGIAGQHYGTGHLALSIALAKQTPITVDKAIVDGIIRHAGEVCVNGHYAYGRGRRKARDDSRKHSGGNAMSGPGLLGVQIGGGHESAVKEIIERMDASIGDGDNSHASSSLAYIFGSLAIAAADEEVYLKHMQNFRYKMTIDDNWEGGYLKSAFPLDLASGEGVTSNWIRTAGYILVMNALEKNMAITGKREFWSKERIKTVAVSEWGGQIHSYYLRNWALVRELLGDQAPPELGKGLELMQRLPRTLGLVPATREIVEDYAPSMIQKIASNSSLKPEHKAYAIELLCGLDFKIYSEKKGDKQEVKLTVNYPLHQLNWLDEDKAAMFGKSAFPLKSTVEIASNNLTEIIKFETEGTKDFNLDQGTRTMSVSKPLKDTSQEQFDGMARITFKLGEHSIVYKRPLKFNIELGHSNNYNLRRLKLKLKVAPRAIFQSQPLIISGIAFDCMYPKERMPELKGPEGIIVNSHEGDDVWVDLASENFICPWVHQLVFTKPTQVSIFKPTKHESVRGSIIGDIEHLYDLDRATTCDLKHGKGGSLIEYDFGKEVALNGLDMNYDRSCFIRVWCQKGDNWIPLVWDNYSPNTGHHPTFPETTASKWRVEVIGGKGKKIQTLRFYHNPNKQQTRSALIQLKDAKYIPEIK